MPAPSANPWSTPAGAPPLADPYDVGGASKVEPDSSGWTNADPGGLPQPAPDPNDWTDQQNVDSSGWTDPGGDVGGGGTDDWT